MAPSRRRVLATVAGFATLGVAGCSSSDDSDGLETQGPDQSECVVENPHPGYDQTEVAVCSDEEELGSVTAGIADTGYLRYTGLSDTVCLPDDRGMLFVYDAADDHTYVMRRMDFAIDIVYADTDGTITSIHHAPEPEPNEDGEGQGYDGFGQYVLEVNYNWTTDRGIEVGDRLVFEL